MTGLGKEPWEVYVVKADADTLAEAEATTGCCDSTGCGSGCGC